MATPKDLPQDIGAFIRDLRQTAKISLRQLADKAGVSNPYLSQIERGLRKPSAEVLQQIASALRVSTPAMYLRAGLLDGEGQQGVLAAIAVDPELTIAQKQSLSQIYETFRNENARGTRRPEEHTASGPPDLRGDEMTEQTKTRFPAPLYAAAGAGDLAYQQLRKLPAVVTELSERAAASLRTVQRAGQHQGRRAARQGHHHRLRRAAGQRRQRGDLASPRSPRSAPSPSTRSGRPRRAGRRHRRGRRRRRGQRRHRGHRGPEGRRGAPSRASAVAKAGEPKPRTGDGHQPAE